MDLHLRPCKHPKNAANLLKPSEDNHISNEYYPGVLFSVPRKTQNWKKECTVLEAELQSSYPVASLLYGDLPKVSVCLPDGL